MSDHITKTLLQILQVDHHIEPDRAKPSARLRQDLGMTSSSARKFFKFVQERFGTDFSELNENWDYYFGQDNQNRIKIIVACAILALTGVLIGAGIAWLRLPFPVGELLCVPLGLGFMFLISRLLSQARVGQITLSDVTEAVRKGAW